MARAAEALREVKDDARASPQVAKRFAAEVVADKGYHSSDVVRDLSEMGIRSYVPEPRRKGRRLCAAAWGVVGPPQSAFDDELPLPRAL